MTSRAATDDLGVPTFGRVEIALTTPTRDCLKAAASELRDLADKLETLANDGPMDEAATLVLAHARIKAASGKLRGTK